MLNAVLIGTSGHFMYAVEGIGKGADCRIVGASPGPDGLIDEQAVKKLGVPLYSDYIHALDDLKPDIAIINPRFDQISVCLIEVIKRGITAFCEKPIAATHKALEAVKDEQKKTGARICAMMGMRHESAFAALKSVIETDSLGDISLIHAQKSYKLGIRPDYYRDRDTYGGTIPWVGSHPIDMVYWLTDRKKYLSISALHTTKNNSDNGSLEASAAILADMEGGIITTINIDYLRPQCSSTHGDDRIRIMGSKNWAEVVNGKLYIGGTEYDNLPCEGNIFIDLCEELQGNGTCSITTEDSIYVTEICLRSRDMADNQQ